MWKIYQIVGVTLTDRCIYRPTLVYGNLLMDRIDEISTVLSSFFLRACKQCQIWLDPTSTPPQTITTTHTYQSNHTDIPWRPGHY